MHQVSQPRARCLSRRAAAVVKQACNIVSSPGRMGIGPSVKGPQQGLHALVVSALATVRPGTFLSARR